MLTQNYVLAVTYTEVYKLPKNSHLSSRNHETNLTKKTVMRSNYFDSFFSIEFYFIK